MADKTAPRFPCGSVDLDVLHEADAKGHDLAKALAKATTLPKAPEPAAEPAPAPATKAKG